MHCKSLNKLYKYSLGIFHSNFLARINSFKFVYVKNTF